jgi:hypothetical protein
MLATKDVQRQIAVTAVVTVKEPAFLVPVQRIVRRIQIQPDFFRRLLVRFQKQIHQQPIKRIRIRRNPLVAILGSRIRCAKLQPIERARTRQRKAPVPSLLPSLARQISLACQQRQHAVRAQGIVIVQIFIAQRQTINTLRHQLMHAVLDALRIAVIGETRRQPIQRSHTLINLTQQQAAAV